MATKFKVRSGYHSDGRKVYRKGATFISDKPLHKAFHNKFDIVKTDVEMPVEKEEKGKKRPRYNRVEAMEELGKDVTQKFPDAINKGLRVYQQEDGEYNVASETDLFTPLNTKPLTRVRTKKFLLEQ